jgi:hypothetical protein
MKERAEKIGARVKVWSRAGAGTEVELTIPNHLAFENESAGKPFGWLSKFLPRRKKV